MSEKEVPRVFHLDFSTIMKDMDKESILDPSGKPVTFKNIAMSALRAQERLLENSISNDEYYMSFGIGQKLCQNKTEYTLKEVSYLLRLFQTWKTGFPVDIVFAMLKLLGDDSVPVIE